VAVGVSAPVPATEPTAKPKLPPRDERDKDPLYKKLKDALMTAFHAHVGKDATKIRQAFKDLTGLASSYDLTNEEFASLVDSVQKLGLSWNAQASRYEFAKPAPAEEVTI
jgi:hypothetical protein